MQDVALNVLVYNAYIRPAIFWFSKARSRNIVCIKQTKFDKDYESFGQYVTAVHHVSVSKTRSFNSDSSVI